MIRISIPERSDDPNALRCGIGLSKLPLARGIRMPVSSVQFMPLGSIRIGRAWRQAVSIGTRKHIGSVSWLVTNANLQHNGW